MTMSRTQSRHGDSDAISAADDTTAVLDVLSACWRLGEAPTPDELAGLLGWPLARTERRLHRLEAARLVYRHRRWGSLRPGVTWGRS